MVQIEDGVPVGTARSSPRRIQPDSPLSAIKVEGPATFHSQEIRDNSNKPMSALTDPAVRRHPEHSSSLTAECSEFRHIP